MDCRFQKWQPFWFQYKWFKSYGQKHVFNKNRKLNLYILWRIYKGRLCTEWIFHICKIMHMSFFYNNCNWVVNSSFCNPWRCWYANNNRRTWHKSKFSHFAVYFSIFFYCKFLSKLHITFITILHKIFHQIFWFLS